jgi:orotidine-5'-phosphate decarboxylase
MSSTVLTQTYGERAKRQTNKAAKALLETMERKESNLCVSVDVTKSKDLLAIVDAVGPYICLIKAFPSFLDTFTPFSLAFWVKDTY